MPHAYLLKRQAFFLPGGQAAEIFIGFDLFGQRMLFDALSIGQHAFRIRRRLFDVDVAAGLRHNRSLFKIGEAAGTAFAGVTGNKKGMC